MVVAGIFVLNFKLDTMMMIFNMMMAMIHTSSV